jgi:hypothetical protein
MHPRDAEQSCGQTQLHDTGSHIVLSGHPPPQFDGQVQVQPFAGSHWPIPGQVHVDGHTQSQSDVLHTVPGAQVPPQSAGHWQLHASVLHTVFVPAHAPPQSEPQTHEQLAWSQVVPLGHAPLQSGAHSQEHVAWLQTSFGPHWPLQSGVHAHWQLASQTSVASQFALHCAWSQVHTPSCGLHICPCGQGPPQGGAGGSHRR